MKIIFLSWLFCFCGFVGFVFADTQNELFVGAQSTMLASQQQHTTEETKQRLHHKIEQTVRILQDMDESEKQEWITRYQNKMEAAITEGNHLKSFYYQEILERVEHLELH